MDFPTLVMWIKFALWAVALVFVHELGHYIVAKRRGIFRCWGVSRLYAYIKLTTTHFPNRYDYLSGMILSLFLLPILWLVVGNSLLFLIGIVCCLVLGIMDLADCYYFSRIKRTGRWEIMNQINNHILGLIKVGVFTLILFFVILFATICAGFPKLAVNPLFVIGLVTICIIVSLKATKWISKLGEISRQLDNL